MVATCGIFMAITRLTLDLNMGSSEFLLIARVLGYTDFPVQALLSRSLFGESILRRCFE